MIECMRTAARTVDGKKSDNGKGLIGKAVPANTVRRLTHMERIQSMTAEELAEWISNLAVYTEEDENADDYCEPYISIYDLDSKKEETVHDSYGDVLKWLNSETE